METNHMEANHPMDTSSQRKNSNNNNLPEGHDQIPLDDSEPTDVTASFEKDFVAAASVLCSLSTSKFRSLEQSKPASPAHRSDDVVVDADVTMDVEEGLVTSDNVLSDTRVSTVEGTNAAGDGSVAGHQDPPLSIVPSLEALSAECAAGTVTVYSVHLHSTYVTPASLSQLKQMKGSDASNLYDEEVRNIRNHTK